MKILYSFLLLLSSVVAIPAAQAQKDITAADSVRLHRYMDSLNHCRLFSYKRQRYWDSALSIRPTKAYWWQQKSIPLMKQHKYEIAMRYVDSAVKYDKGRYLDYRAFCKCIFQKSYRAALADFEEADKLSHGAGVMDHTYDFYKGLCYLQLNIIDSALYALNTSIDGQRAQHGDSWVHYLDLFYLGIIYYDMENYNKAIECFDKSMLQYAHFSDAKYYKALSLLQLHRSKEALPVIMDADKDYKEGYTINEDNSLYEIYPYQINQRYYLDHAVKDIQAIVKEGE
jgi:tetratricopeptide (TPR) repeat protein